MSSFTQNLSITKLKKKLWRVNRAFKYHVGSKESKEIVAVPKGYITDGASIPRFLWGIVGHPFGRYAQAAVVHDLCYEKNLYSRKRSDEIFLEAMQVLGVPWLTRRIIFRAVRMFGWISYKKVL